MNPIWHLLWVLPLLYLALIVWIYLFQERLLFMPTIPGRELAADPSAIDLPFDEVTIKTQDAETLHGWWLPADGADLSVLFLHGNAGNISHRLDSLALFHRLGVNVLIIDYRGYGRSSGSPSEEGILRDAEAAWLYLTETMGLSPARIVVFGRSLGGAAAAWLASRVDVGGLILESTFTSAPDAAADVYWWLPVRWLSRLRLDTRDWLTKVRCPVLIVHSRDDEIIPFYHARRLYEAAPPDKRLVAIKGDHNTAFLLAGEDYRRVLRDFLQQVPADP
jgi:fermentation-respiration switch protein FrsA (DUF1100 family)